jgi:nucleoside-diphosphate-sugar epimerase
MRFDLTVNEFMRDITLDRELVVFAEQFWRRYCHVEDLARACIMILECEENKMDHQIFNIGDSREN